MSQFSELQVRQALVTEGGTLVDRKGSSDGVAFSDGIHGSMFAAAKAGRLFKGANQAAVATSTTLNTTWTGLGISNPSGNSKVFNIRRFSWMLSVVGPAAGALGLVLTTHAAGAFASAVSAVNAYTGVATGSTAILDNGATVVAGTIVEPITTYGTGAITTWQGAGWQSACFDGSLIVPPGYCLITDTTTACTAAFLFGFVWEEVNI